MWYPWNNTSYMHLLKTHPFLLLFIAIFQFFVSVCKGNRPFFQYFCYFVCQKTNSKSFQYLCIKTGLVHLYHVSTVYLTRESTWIVHLSYTCILQTNFYLIKWKYIGIKDKGQLWLLISFERNKSESVEAYMKCLFFNH